MWSRGHGRPGSQTSFSNRFIRPASTHVPVVPDSVLYVAAAIQRERPEVPAPHRSVIPSVSGVPAGAAVLIAVACTSIGFFIDASGGGKDLTHVFAAFYIVGCAAAALVVRYRGLFTTMVTPPLLLFLAVPVAYQQLLGHSSTSMRDIVLNLAVPLVNRFPTMAIATVVVLAIGLARMLMQRRLAEATPGTRTSGPRKGDSWGTRAGSGGRRRAGTSDGKRGRGGPPAADDTAAKPTRTGRKTTGTSGRVAERPPRVGSRAAERTAVATPAAARGRDTADTPSRHRASADAPSRQRTDADARPRRGSADQPPRQRGRGSADPQPRQRTAAADPQPRQRTATTNPRQRTTTDPQARRPRTDPRAEYGEVPPHPRPNVRYREA